MASPSFDTDAFDTDAFDTDAFDLDAPTPPTPSPSGKRRRKIAVALYRRLIQKRK